MKIITTLFIIFICSITFGQTFKGKIIDKQNQPISFANVISKSRTDDSLVTGIISHENDEFSITPKKKDVYIEISFVTKRINLNQPNIEQLF